MSARGIIYVISFPCYVIGCFLMNMFQMMIVDQTNDKRQVGNHISHLGRHSPRIIIKMFGEYRSLYPQGKLHIYALVSLALVVISMIIIIVNSLPLS